jgi:hypothetical protein
MIRQLDSGLWVAESPLRMYGVELGARMTVMQISGGLLVHSPISAASELVQEVEALGRVTHVVAPSRFHHLFVGEWQQAFPDAAVYAAPGVEAKRPELSFDGLLTGDPEPAWADTVDQVLLEGIPATNEAVFFHKPSATLIASDLAFNIGPSSPPLTRFAFRMSGTYGRLRPTFLERLLVRDRAAFRRSLARILRWPFERVVVAHGDVVEENGRDELVRGYAWILDGASDASEGAERTQGGDVDERRS